MALLFDTVAVPLFMPYMVVLTHTQCYNSDPVHEGFTISRLCMVTSNTHDRANL